MNKAFSKMILSVTHGAVLAEEQWRVIVQEVLGELSHHLGESFEIDPDPNFFGKGFSLWLFSEDPRGMSTPTTWSGVLSGRVIDPNWFSIEFSQFLFDRATRRRIQTDRGNYLAYIFLVKEGEMSKWRSLGWSPDEYDEWDDVPFPENDRPLDRP